MSWRQTVHRPQSVWIGVALIGMFLLHGSSTASAHAAERPVVAAPAAAGVSPTFTRDVAPILQRSCQQCHRPNGIGPMALETYEQTRQYARLVKQRVDSRTMPPWHINRAVGIREFKNDVSLTDAEIDTIVRWVDAGSPRGDPADLPPPIVHRDPTAWGLADRFGPPDLVVRSTPYTVVATGQDQWWSHRVPFDGLDEERWVRAAEFKPAYPLGKVVHHGHATLITQDGTGARSVVGLARFGLGKSWDILPEGTGIHLPPGPGTISWALHYFPIGEEAKDDVIEVGVWFYPKGMEPTLASAGELQYLIDGTSDARGSRGTRAKDLLIPPHGKLVLEDTYVLDSPAMLYSFRPHVHMRGSGMSVEAVYPDDRKELLSLVDRYSHLWQITYLYADHVRPLLPSGTVLLLHAFFDNTSNNPINPDPDQWVGFGSRGVDEMSHAWLGIIELEEAEYDALVAEREARETGGQE